MLLQFSFKNFKSFRDDACIDLTATKAQEFNNHIVTIGNEKVLPVAAIFGANAGGKSNVYEAFRYMSDYVICSLSYGGETSKKARQMVKPNAFAFDKESKKAPSTFEVYFIDSEENGAKSYNYGFVVDAEGVKEEWLNYRSRTSRGDYKKIFHRYGDTLDLTGIPTKFHENIKVSLNRKTLVVSLGANLRIDKLKRIRDWFVANEFADFGHPIENFFLSTLIPENFSDDKTVQKKVVNYLSSFDPSIIDFNVEVMEREDEEDIIKIDAVHKMINSKETATIPLQNESAGTLKMFALYPMFQEVMEKGGVYFIDELNARLHPLLVRNFIISFLDPDINKNHAQLVFTSHDTWQLNSGMLRRDEIWFAEKDNNGISTLYSLADFKDDDGAKIRYDENFEKNYMLGKYGAIPNLRNINV